jgi:DNA-binding MurR/RpiR family transcriptional regulator
VSEKTPQAPSADAAERWLLDLVQAHRLSPTQRRVVQHMLDSLPEVAFASIVEVAEGAGVSQPTVTRIASALGFSGYADFRSAIREVVLSPPAPPAVLAGGSRSSRRSGGDGERSVLGFEQANLRTVEDTIDGERMQRAVDLLAVTRPLGVIGLRASAALAQYFGYFAQRVLPDVRVLDDAASLDDAVLQLKHNGATALLAIVMPRYPASAIRALATARQLGLSTVAIVDTPLVPFSELVDVTLVAPVGQYLVFDSHAATVTLSIALLDALAGRDPRRTQERLEAHEKLVAGWELKSR